VLWAEGYWFAAGDRVTFRLRGPDGGTVVDHVMKIDQGQQRWLGFAGAPRPGQAWPAGTYAGEVVLERDMADGLQRVTIERAVALPGR
jgi:hypothetical protein